MINIGIKNAVLFLILILIVHVWLKNNLGQAVPLAATHANAARETFAAACDERTKMMAYVAGPNERDLDKAFSQKILRECDDGGCVAPKKDDSKMPLPTTCDANIQDLTVDEGMKVKADCKLAQEHKGFMVIKEYENEKDMNGGKVLEGLDAFDNFDHYFEAYSAQCR